MDALIGHVTHVNEDKSLNVYVTYRNHDNKEKYANDITLSLSPNNTTELLGMDIKTLRKELSHDIRIDVEERISRCDIVGIVDPPLINVKTHKF